MQITIKDSRDLGLVVRATRKTQGLRIDDLAAFAGVGPVFAIDVEHGKPTLQFGRLLRVLEQLGLRLTVELPDSAGPALEALRSQGLRRRKKAAESPGLTGKP
ncbi:MAG TPA: hypothetical protein VH542_04210 [Steroidobacteraceae bacterium]|jgi:transcriptional regulator with XRE-family HTH domain